MKGLVCALVVGVVCLLAPSLAETTEHTHPPKVQVYSRGPGQLGKPNVLICHASEFHPPEIKLELLKDGQVIQKTNQTDLAFEENWFYHITKSAAFTPVKGETYACRVTHLGKTNMFSWEDDM